MSNFTDFFPAAAATPGGAGGGFTKVYSLHGNTSEGVLDGGYTANSTSITLDVASATSFAIGIKFILKLAYPAAIGPYIVEKTGNNGGNSNTFDFVGATIPNNYTDQTICILVANQDVVVNPATDLGLADNAQIGYFMIGGGASGYSTINQSVQGGGGGVGGRYRSGTLTISTSSTDLVLTTGGGGGRQVDQGNSTMVYGSTTISTSGYPFGWGGWRIGGYGQQNFGATAAFSGINGYGMGGSAGNNTLDAGGAGPNYPQGYGTGGACSTVGTNFAAHGGGAGAILLYY
tara:strand:- start:428 stop:1294 length:867 start_codon:yes stop_codon:yes gene_type:complete